ncbi:MAG: tRNA (adenine37-N(6))-methyltransferase TrmN6 (EC [uncultured Sulfurovum sp.]|uniref:tRNA (Adenine37-N(6))-methyltransferase TrmN6 (EC) n=1 Tax=uncultured Sulfurovum sp. TaxID=269237 RepID=A0A6S6RZP6_9BACT|nr:MAG: tRNA (adenine37-N(6))-methyltransferase TrmN6 (EC [uncultured Sulfurovum sp.]
MYLYQPSSGYAYNSDSIFLYDFISKFKPKGSLLDVGCGVGIISLLLSRDFNIQTTIVDKQEIMLQYAKHNYALNQLEVKATRQDFTMFSEKEKFDYVVSNPPFYDQNVTQSENEHLNIARYAQHLPIETFIAKVKKVLKPRGRFIFCYDAKQVDKLLHSLITNKLNPEQIRFVHSKIDRDSKLVMIAARMNSKSMMKVLPPLVVFNEQSNYNNEAKKAFEKAGTNSIKGDY